MQSGTLPIQRGQANDNTGSVECLEMNTGFLQGFQ